MGAKGKTSAATYLEVDEFNLWTDLLQSEEKYTWELYCKVAFYTGLRYSDIATLKWRQILDIPELEIKEQKTGKIRKIDLTDENYSKINKIRDLHQQLGSAALDTLILQSTVVDGAFNINYMNRIFNQIRTTHNITQLYENKDRINIKKNLPEIQDRLKIYYEYRHKRDEQIVKTFDGLHYKLQEIKDQFDIPLLHKRITTHTFRKTFGRCLYEKMERTEYALLLLMDIFGHSSLEVTKRYLGLRGEEFKQAYRLIPA